MDAELPCLTPRSFPRAIVHVDMDSFFAACEQQRDPKLRGVPVVVGQERGIATAMSIEAKRAGVTRGMRLADIRRVCPECVILPSDYETFGLYSLRMFEIVRHYSDEVEEYSIDECFADITGMRRSLKMTYGEIITTIKQEIDTRLGTVCSIGLAPTKTLAKVASKWQKPNGATIIPGTRAQYYLRDLPIGDVWGIGGKTEQYLSTKGIRTALQFAYQPEAWVREHCTKPHLETWHELRGSVAKPLQTEPVSEYHTISKRKTFTPPSRDRREVYGRLCKNVENACRKARRYGLVSKHAFISLTTQNFRHLGCELTLAYPTSDPITFIEHLPPCFTAIFRDHTDYRTTMFCLLDLTEDTGQLDLFGNQVVETKRRDLYRVVDAVTARYGKHAVHLGSSQHALQTGDHAGSRGEPAWRKRQENWLPGETARRRVNIPYCGYVS